jgi:hypothetical protein
MNYQSPLVHCDSAALGGDIFAVQKGNRTIDFLSPSLFGGSNL